MRISTFFPNLMRNSAPLGPETYRKYETRRRFLRKAPGVGGAVRRTKAWIRGGERGGGRRQQRSETCERAFTRAWELYPVLEKDAPAVGDGKSEYAKLEVRERERTGVVVQASWVVDATARGLQLSPPGPLTPTNVKSTEKKSSRIIVY